MKLSRKPALAALAVLTCASLCAKTVEFSGYTWNVRPAGSGGPGPNNWSEENVWVDTNGFLHLKLSNRNGTWSCAEVTLPKRLGFGLYEFSIVAPLDRLDPNVVIGLFNYPTRDVGPDGTHEIDIEFARWGRAQNPVGNYTVWPTERSRRQVTKPFTLDSVTNWTTHSFSWTSTNIVFQSRHGDSAVGKDIAQWACQPAEPEKSIAQKPMPVHINLWCFQGKPPTDNKEMEVVIRTFKFTELRNPK